MPGDTACSAAISACEKGLHQQQDTMLLNQMQQRGLMTGDTAYSAAISVCEKGPEEQQVYSAAHTTNVQPYRADRVGVVYPRC